MKETTVYFGPERALIGTHTFVNGDARVSADLAVVLTNAGLLTRTGPHGMNVKLARCLARVGVPSLRFDMSGLGDSGRPARQLPAERQFVLDTRLALDEAQARHGVRRFAMIGFCSGADVAHMAALEDERLCGLLLWDPYIYPTWKSKLVALREGVREFGVLGTGRRGLRRAAHGISELLKRRWQRAEGRQTTAPLRFGRTYIPPAEEYAGRLRQLLDRGVDITIVYSGGFPNDYNYATQYRDSFRGCGLADRISCIYLPHADHILTLHSAQQALLRIAVEWVESLQVRPPAAACAAAAEGSDLG